jgi:hypothetical protein
MWTRVGTSAPATLSTRFARLYWPSGLCEALYGNALIQGECDSHFPAG